MTYGRNDGFDDSWGRYAEGETIKALTAALGARRTAKPEAEEEHGPDPTPEAIQPSRTTQPEAGPEPKAWDFTWAEATVAATMVLDPIEGEAEVMADETVREPIMQNTPDMPVMVVSPEPVAALGEMTFEQIIQPIAVELGSAFTGVIDEMGQASTIRLDGPAAEKPKPRGQANRHRGGVSGYGSPLRGIKVHLQNIEKVSDRNKDSVGLNDSVRL